MSNKKVTNNRRIKRAKWMPASGNVRLLMFSGLFVLVIFLLLLVNQAKIAKIGFENSKTESLVRIMSMNNAQRREILFKSDDYSQIKEQAKALGLYPPTEAQIIRYRITKQDYVTYKENINDGNEERKENDLKRAMKNMSDYLSRMEVKHE